MRFLSLEREFRHATTWVFLCVIFWPLLFFNLAIAEEDFTGDYLCINQVDTGQVAELKVRGRDFQFGRKEYRGSRVENAEQSNDCDLMAAFWEQDAVLNGLCFQGEERKLIGISHSVLNAVEAVNKLTFNCSKLD